MKYGASPVGDTTILGRAQPLIARPITYALGRGCVKTQNAILLDAPISISNRKKEKHRTCAVEFAVHQRLFSVLEIFHTASVESSLNWAGRPSGEPET
jgi:hypothetical protein